jgi:pyruvate dehydrogenase E1 component alpha subunit
VNASRVLKSMLLIRHLEEAMIELYRRNQIPGFIHPAIGEEAVHAGVIDQLTLADHVIATHRGHGQALVKGVDPARMMAEVLGKRDGVLGGRGGSLHIGDWTVGCLPASPLVGGGLGVMSGLGLAHHLAEDGGVGVCFFGDGALNRGAFHEAVNLASVWKLPVIYACIENGWAISVARAKATAGELSARAHAYGIPGTVIDGKDVFACHQAAGETIARARRGDGPSMLFFDCPRGYGHEEGDNQEYRDKAEYEAAVQRDPIKLAVDRWVDSRVLSAEEIKALRDEVAAVVSDAVEFGLASNPPESTDAFTKIRPSETIA